MIRHDGGGLGRARQILRRWLGSLPPIPTTYYAPDLEVCTRDRATIIRQFSRLRPITDHPALAERGITWALLELPRFTGSVLRDENFNVCFPHYDAEGVAGWEIKNRGFTGYAKGEQKGFGLAIPHALTCAL